MVSEDNEEAGSISGIYGGYYFECVYSETAGQWVGVKEDISELTEELFNIWENMCDGDIGGNVIFDTVIFKYYFRHEAAQALGFIAYKKQLQALCFKISCKPRSIDAATKGYSL